MYAGVNYFILGRVLHYIPYLSPIHPGRVVSTFIGLDVLVEILTAQGASRIARKDDPHQQKIGGDLIKASLLLQVALFFCFVALQTLFHRRCTHAGVVTPKLRAILNLLYISNAFIIIRNIYRVTDNFLGFLGYTERHEWCLYVFDALPMLANTLMWNFCYPSIFLPRTDKIYLSQDGRTEREGPGWQDKRHFLLTIFDPFDIGGLIRGKDKQTRYWDNEEQYPVVALNEATTLPIESGRRSLRVKIMDPLNWGSRLVRQSSNVDGAPIK